MAQIAENLREHNRITTEDLKKLKIISFGKENDYPQRIRRFMRASTTAMSCMDVYKKFVYGNGFANDFLSKTKANKKQNFNQVLQDVVNELCENRMIALHFNYNILGDIVSVKSVPITTVRLGLNDELCEVVNIALHDDWSKEDPSTKRIEEKDIDRIDLFNPDIAVIREQIFKAGGIDNYKGQILLISLDGYLEYSLAYIDAIVSDVLTQGSIATVKNRNVRNNFHTSGILVEKINQVQTENQQSDLANQLKHVQGDANSFNILHTTIQTDEEKPEFISFPRLEGDKLFEYTERSIKDNIKEHFKQPGILRGELVAGKLGSTAEVSDLFNYYNELTQSERNIITEIFEKISKYFVFPIDIDSFEIEKKSYITGVSNESLASVLGVGGTQALQGVLIDPALTVNQKRAALQIIFGVNADDAIKLTSL